MADKISVSVIGGSGYVGGDLIRILLGHPNVEFRQSSALKEEGIKITNIHPNLRSFTDSKFVSTKEIEHCDVLFIAIPHGITHKSLPDYLDKADKIIDLSADYRLKDAEKYEHWYGFEHENPDLLKKFVYGLPELHREEIKKTNYAAIPGCGATTMIFGAFPFKDITESCIFDLKFGSSGAGNQASIATHHPERIHAFRAFKPSLHRHTAEVEQELGIKVDVSSYAVELVRGIHSTCHIKTKKELTDKDVWQLLRDAYSDEFFIRVLNDVKSLYRFPEPKILSGTNFVDVGFSIDSRSKRLISFSALDNITRGSAGQAVQSMNLMCGFEETTALKFPGLHPI